MGCCLLQQVHNVDENIRNLQSFLKLRQVLHLVYNGIGGYS